MSTTYWISSSKIYKSKSSIIYLTERELFAASNTPNFPNKLLTSSIFLNFRAICDFLDKEKRL